MEENTEGVWAGPVPEGPPSAPGASSIPDQKFIIRIRKLFVKSDLTEDFLNVIQASIFIRYLDPH